MFLFLQISANIFLFLFSVINSNNRLTNILLKSDKQITDNKLTELFSS